MFVLRGAHTYASESWIGLPEFAKLEELYKSLSSSLCSSLLEPYRREIERASNETKRNDHAKQHEVARLCWSLDIPFAASHTIETTVSSLIRYLTPSEANRFGAAFKKGTERPARQICADWNRYMLLCRQELETKHAAYEATRADTYELALSRVTWETLWDNPAWNSIPSVVKRSKRAAFPGLGRPDPTQPGIVETLQIELNATDMPDVKLPDSLPSFCGKFVCYFAEQAAKLAAREDRYTRLRLFSAFAQSHRRRIDLMAVPPPPPPAGLFTSLPDALFSWIGPLDLQNALSALTEALRRDEHGEEDSKRRPLDGSGGGSGGGGGGGGSRDADGDDDVKEVLPPSRNLTNQELGMAILSIYVENLETRVLRPVYAIGDRVRSISSLKAGLASTHLIRSKLGEDMENYFTQTFEFEESFDEAKSICVPYPHPSMTKAIRVAIEALRADVADAVGLRDRRLRYEHVRRMFRIVNDLLTNSAVQNGHRVIQMDAWEPFPRLHALMTDWANRYPTVVAETPQLKHFQSQEYQTRLTHRENGLRLAISTLAATWSSLDDEYIKEGNELISAAMPVFTAIYREEASHPSLGLSDEKRQPQAMRHPLRPFYFPPWINRRLLSADNPFDVNSVEGKTKDGMLRAFYHVKLSEMDEFWANASKFLRDWPPPPPLSLTGEDVQKARAYRLQYSYSAVTDAPPSSSVGVQSRMNPSDVRRLVSEQNLDLYTTIGYGRFTRINNRLEQERAKRLVEEESARADEKQNSDVALANVLKVYVNYRIDLSDQTEQELAKTYHDNWTWARTSSHDLAMTPNDALREIAAIIFLSFLSLLHHLCAEKAKAWTDAISRPGLPPSSASAPPVARPALEAEQHQQQRRRRGSDD